MRRINKLIASFGLESQADTLVGTPIRKGISGGQKRRLSVASQLITAPKILFMDEPTSGLDSAASFEVMSFVKEVAKKHNVCHIFYIVWIMDLTTSRIVARHCEYPPAIDNDV